MRNPKRVRLIMCAALLALFAAPGAGAQDGPTLTVTPASVDAAGEHEITVSGDGWTAAPPIFVLPCPGAEGSLDAIVESGASLCDTANLTPATPADGSFEVTVTYDVPAEGLVLAAGDAGQTESAAVLIAVGDGAAAEEPPAEEAPPAEEEDPPLANTGAESAPLAIAGAAVLAAGAMVVGFSRKLR